MQLKNCKTQLLPSQKSACKAEKLNINIFVLANIQSITVMISRWLISLSLQRTRIGELHRVHTHSNSWPIPSLSQDLSVTMIISPFLIGLDICLFVFHCKPNRHCWETRKMTKEGTEDCCRWAPEGVWQGDEHGYLNIGIYRRAFPILLSV